MANSRAKFLPNLREYVAQREISGPNRFGWGPPLFLIASIGIFAGLCSILPFGWAVVAGLCGVAPVMLGTFAAIDKKLNSPRNVQEALAFDSKKIIDDLKQKAQDSKLHRFIDPPAAALLEESARNWLRIRDCLNGQAWQTRDLADHWKQVRENALAVSNSAMDDLLLHLKSSIRKQGKAETWESKFREFLEDVVGLQSSLDPGFVPPEFEPARQIGEKLRDLANQVENASKRLVEEAKTGAGTAQSLDAVLSELKAIEVAETELNQHLRH
jgi:hypothetical protein